MFIHTEWETRRKKRDMEEILAVSLFVLVVVAAAIVTRQGCCEHSCFINRPSQGHMAACNCWKMCLCMRAVSGYQLILSCAVRKCPCSCCWRPRPHAGSQTTRTPSPSFLPTLTPARLPRSVARTQLLFSQTWRPWKTCCQTLSTCSK